MIRGAITLTLLAALTAQAEDPNVLPDPLIARDGTTIDTPEAWREKRRPEVLDLFGTYLYGHTPKEDVTLRSEVFDEEPRALDGKAIRKQVALYLSRNGKELRIDLLMYLPPSAANEPVPVFSLLNFCGNHTVHTDPALARPRGPVPKQFQLDERGAKASRFPVEAIVERGYGLATAFCGDIDPDFDDGFKNGAHALFDSPGDRAGDAWGTIGAWAWGLSRILDYLVTDPHVDADHVAVLGHSRLGKTALWAGAQDKRFALVISNDSGSGGAALARNKKGERIKDGIRVFPYWYCTNYQDYIDHEEKLPMDQHMLIALLAPRPVYVASAREDDWADPEGEHLSCVHAGPVYALFGMRGVGSAELPPVDTPLHDGAIGYHMRTGKHDLTAYDWQQYMNFADRKWDR